jgi:hypothetical protein
MQIIGARNGKQEKIPSQSTIEVDGSSPASLTLSSLFIEIIKHLREIFYYLIVKIIQKHH